jgi:deoxyribodipyrimidine photo-lyase
VSVPAARIRVLRDEAPSVRGEYVVYWMIAARRTRFNFALQRALELSRELGRPLLILEALRVDYPWASDRTHAFVLQGMADNQRACAKSAAHYYPYVEPRLRAGKGLLAALGRRACAVVTDDYPCFFLPHMLARAAQQLRVRLEAVDGNGLLPLSFADGRAFSTAHSFRGFMQKRLEDALSDLPLEQPLRRARLPPFTSDLTIIERRYPRAALGQLNEALAALPIDHGVARVTTIAGGQVAGARALRSFLGDGLGRYAEDHNHPDQHAASGLSPYLHFGQLSAHEVFRGVCAAESWDGIPARGGRSGAREGFWGMSRDAEAFLDELITWRELALNGAANLPDFDQYRSLPAWAKRTLSAHAGDARPALYTLAQLERGETADPIWNAAQRELLRSGRIHNYLRMLWGKNILAWSKTPQQALERLVELNNKYALDGRDPNSYAGIFWILGRYDRPWGPERAIFGSVRFMSSDATRRKLELRDYLRTYGA